MKKAVMTLMLLAGLTAMAQRGPHGEGKRMAMQDMTVEQIATLQTKKMTLALDLSDAQQKEIQQLNVENATERKARIEERKAKKEEKEVSKPSADERFAMQSDRLDQAIAHKKKMKKILSDEQFTKWEKMQVHKLHHMRGKGQERRVRK